MEDPSGGPPRHLTALSTAMFALTLRVGSESDEAPPGLLAPARHPRLAPALCDRHNGTMIRAV